VLSADVMDGAGLPGHAELTFSVNGAPSMSITAPADGSQYLQGATVGLVGSANDGEDGDLGASILWSSDRDGALGGGASLNVTSLSVGTHVLAGVVTDSGGLAANAQINVTINAPNMAPSVGITAPISGAQFLQGVSVGFTGSASDPEDLDLSASISWSSSIDGSLGSGASLSRSDLSLGTHILSADVMDSGGLPGHAEIAVVIHRPPVVNIASPAGGGQVNQGDLVDLIGTASDPEDGDLTAAIAWTSDQDGLIAIGGSVSSSSLSPGAHVLSADVLDGGGATGHAEVTLTVNAAPVVNIVSPSDGGLLALGIAMDLVSTATDLEDGDVGASVVWTSSLEGELGTGAILSYTPLTLGAYAITASAEDGSALPGFDQVVVVVPEPGVRASLVAGLALVGMLRHRARRRRDLG
jgi:hypothetical protein